MSDAHEPPPRRRLGDLLIDAGVITPTQLSTALKQQQSTDGRRRRLGTVLRDLGVVDEHDIVWAMSEQLGLEVVGGAALHAAPQAAIDAVPRRVASRHELIPLDLDRETGHIVIAMADPTNVVALDDLRSLQRISRVTYKIATPTEIVRARSLLYERGVADATVQEMSVDLAEEDEEVDLDVGSDDEPVVRLVNALLTDAIRSRASDVHVEPGKAGMRVRYRVDGLLREVQHIPRQMAAAVTSRLKVMSALDIAERRRPQDGRSSIRVDGEEVDMRVATMPALHGETVVLRLLRKGAARMNVDDLGFDDDQYAAFSRAVGRSQGLIIMTGPTGSGKTTTLYAGLARLTDPTRNIITLEDPVEYQMDGVNQTQMNDRIGMTFATSLRATLRHDPDVVMVGEIRDGETATLAVEASFTGHLVLTTLHTNDAPSTVARLVELGVERFLLGTTLAVAVAQRLARRVCDQCAVPVELAPAVVEELEMHPSDLAGGDFRRGEGCVECDGTGFYGRVGLYEILRVTPRMRQLITDGGSELQIAALARVEGMTSLRQDGIRKAKAGVTTLAEVVRVTPEDQFTHERAGGGQQDTTATAVRVGAIDAHRVLVVGEPAAAEVVADAPDGWRVSVATDIEDAIERVQSEDPAVVVVAENGDGSGTDRLLRWLRDEVHDNRPVIVRSPTGVAARRLTELQALGVHDALEGDLDGEQLRGVLLASVIGS